LFDNFLLAIILAQTKKRKHQIKNLSTETAYVKRSFVWLCVNRNHCSDCFPYFWTFHKIFTFWQEFFVSFPMSAYHTPAIYCYNAWKKTWKMIFFEWRW